jgi:hypothetical protein
MTVKNWYLTGAKKYENVSIVRVAGDDNLPEDVKAIVDRLKATNPDFAKQLAAEERNIANHREYNETLVKYPRWAKYDAWGRKRVMHWQRNWRRHFARWCKEAGVVA